MADVFISYATADRSRVKPIVDAIEGAGHSVWWDRKIGIGNSFDREIERELDSAGCIVVVWSSHSVNSDWVRIEAQEGLERGILVPLLVDDVRPPLAFRRAQTAVLSPSLSNDELQPVLAAIDACMRRNTPSSASNPAPVSMAREGKRKSETALAVLPFENLSSDPEQEFFSDGIAEDVLNGLARSPDVVTRGRNSSFSLRGERIDTRTIASRLNVTHIVGGSVRTVGNRVRVNAWLADAVRDAEVWTGRYDRELEDVFAVQDEITGSILDALNLRFSRPKRQSVSLDAYDVFLKGRYHFGRLEVRAAMAAFEKAIEIEPNYAEALSYLGYMYGILHTLGAYSSNPLREGFLERQRTLMGKALSADPHDPSARGFASRALGLQDRINELNGLLREHSNNPNLWFVYGFVFRFIGRSDVELKVREQQVAFDPLYPDVYRMRGEARLFCGKFEEAMEDFEAFEKMSGRPAPFLTSQVAFYRCDAASLERLIMGDPSTWDVVPYFKTIMSAALAYLQEDHTGVTTALAPLGADTIELSSLVKYWVALLQRDTALALSHYRASVREGEHLAIQDIQGSAGLRAMFPDYFEQPEYAAMLSEFGVDGDSVADLVIPDLPH